MVSVTDTRTGQSSTAPLVFTEWLAAVATHHDDAALALLRRAWQIAERTLEQHDAAHYTTRLQTSLSVANIAAGLQLDAEAIGAALLLEAADYLHTQDLAANTSPTLARLVEGVARMRVLEKADAAASPTEPLRKMLLAMVEDIRVVAIKLAERLQRMRTLGELPLAEQHAIAQQTLDIFAPLANRLGIWQIKWEMEDLCLKYLAPEDYKSLAQLVAERRIAREDYIARFVTAVTDALRTAGISAEVVGRPKHIYSIWRKMRSKHLSFDRISDVRAVRILVNTLSECYAALGVVHATWQYLPSEFDDYIATPKGNNYQSVHTAVLGPEQRVVEVQIRTHAMHEHAERGVAAHWSYKEGGSADTAYQQKLNLLRELLAWKQDVAQSGGALTHLGDVFQDRIYVFTPQGNIIDLPQGATPLDFAYHIHSGLGHRCRGAKVDGQMVPLQYALQTGQRVEILTIKQGTPSRDWLSPQLGYITTERARHVLQHWFRVQEHDQYVSAGRAWLTRELHRLGHVEPKLDTLAQRLGYPQVDDMLAAMGRNEVKPTPFANALAIPKTAAEDERPLAPRAPTAAAASGAVNALGVGDLLTTMAGCCRPLPGDVIVGYITRGRGITIHRADCVNINNAHRDAPDRVIPVDWGNTTQAVYAVTLRITAADRQGLLRDISAACANERVNVIAVNTLSDKQRNLAHMTLTVEVSDNAQLDRVLAQITQVPGVLEARRQTR